MAVGQSDVELALTTTDASNLLTMTASAESIEDEDDSGTYVFMNSWSVTGASDAEATLDFVFTGSDLSYEYEIEFIVAAPDSDNSALQVVDSDFEFSGVDSGSASESSSGGRPLWHYLIAIILIVAILYFFVL